MQNNRIEWNGMGWDGMESFKVISDIFSWKFGSWERIRKRHTHTYKERQREIDSGLRCVSQYALGSHKFESLWSTRTFPVIHHPDCMAKPTVSELCGHSARGAILDKVLKIHIPRKRNNKILMLSVYFNLTPLEKGFLLELSRSYCF